MQSIDTASRSPAQLQATMEQQEDLSKAQEKNLEKLRDAANRFESYFVKLLMDKMDTEAFSSDLFGESKGEKTFKSRLHQKYSDRIASSKSGFGVSELMYDSLKEQVKRGVSHGSTK